MSTTAKRLMRGAGGGGPKNYIEDVFSTYLYTGTGTGYAGSEQNIINGIDVSGKGALIWIKARELTNAYNSYWNRHQLYDTNRGITFALNSNTTDAHGDTTDSMSTRADGFRLASGGSYYQQNFSGVKYVSWTFRKQPKFFDIVSYTGNGSVRTIAHNLGSVPGCMIIKDCTNAGSAWAVYHVSNGNTKYLQLQDTGAAGTSSGYWNNTTPTSTEFTIGTNGNVNQSGATYIAYLFASNAGGFGLTGTDNVISCGSFSCPGGANATVNLGYEPQWVLFKDSGADGNWQIADNMRGFYAYSKFGSALYPNLSTTEAANQIGINLTNTGFESVQGQLNGTFIYIAIRRGPMKVPTSGTSVFSPVAQTNTGSQPFPVTAGFPVDSAWFGQRSGWGVNFITSDRLRGATNLLLTTATTSESYNNSTYGPSTSKLDSNTQFFDGLTNASEPDIYWMFKRAPSFFDVVCYTGTGSITTQTHNLGVVPELMIIRGRSVISNWSTWTTGFTIGPTTNQYVNLNDNSARDDKGATDYWGSSYPTSSVFSIGTSNATNGSGYTYVAYLFATLAGISKVGSYTGTGTTLQVNCGFAAGARFVLIKRTDSTGSWHIWDTARGIIAGNDPYLLLNSTAAEVTNTDYIDSYAAGFELSSTAPVALNANGGTYIFLAIA